jgi:ParB family chromosome partitioning protein
VPAEKQPRRLGRGLEALLGNAGGLNTSDEGALKSIPIAQIRKNPFQPRAKFSSEELAELAQSLRASGLLQPITVRRRSGQDGFELIAGERRLRAATQLGWKEIPAVIKEVDDKTLLTLALVENLQRSDLNPVEEGEGYHRLAEEFGLSQQEIAQTVGKDRTTVANMLRVLQLPDPVRALMQQGKLSLGHAKVLLGAIDERRIISLANQVVEEGWSVRELERRLKEEATVLPTKKAGRPRSRDHRAPEIRRLEDRLRRFLQTDVSAAVNADNRGSLSIQFYSVDDLERILERMGVPD